MDFVSTREPEPLLLRLEARAEDRRIERIGETIAHEGRVFILHVHVELADKAFEKLRPLAKKGLNEMRQSLASAMMLAAFVADGLGRLQKASGLCDEALEFYEALMREGKDEDGTPRFWLS